MTGNNDNNGSNTQKKSGEIASLSSRSGGTAFCVAIIFYLVFSLIVQMILSVVGKSGGLLFTAISFLIPAVVLVGVILFFGFTSGVKFTQITATKKFNPIYIVASLLLGVGMLLGLGFVNSAFANLIKKIGWHVSSSEIKVDSVTSFIVYTLCACLIPAIVEECFFRGFLLGTVKRESEKFYSDKNVWAFVTVALCFALYHCSLTQLVYQFIYGMGFAILTIKAKSTLPAMITHFANNFVVILLTYLNKDLSFSPMVIIIGIVCLVAFVLMMVFIKDKQESKQTKDENETAQGTEYMQAENNKKRVSDFWLPFGIIGSVACILVALLSAIV